MGVGRVHKWPAIILVQGLAFASSTGDAQAQEPAAPALAEVIPTPGLIPENLLITLTTQDAADLVTAQLSGQPISEVAMAPSANLSPMAGETPKLPEPAFGIALKRLSGNSMEFASLDKSLSGRITFSSGSDVYRPGQHLLANSLTARNSWRREVNVSLAVPDPDGVGFTLTAGAYSGRMPMLWGVGTRHGVGEFTRWQESNSWELGAAIALPDSGMRYSGGVSWSQFSLVDATRVDRRDSLLSPRPRWRSGLSQWHKVETDLWKNANGQASAYAFYGTMDADYRSYRSGSDSPLIFDGKTFELGGEVSHGRSKFTFSHSSTDGNELALSETMARIKTGSVDLRLEKGSWTIRDSDLAGWWIKDSFWKGRARLSLKNLLGGGFGKGILPGEAGFRIDQTRSTSSNSFNPVTRDRTKLGFGLTWTGNNRMAEIYLSRVTTDRPATLVSGPSREQELSIDFNGSLSGEGWDLSYYGSIGDQDGPFSSNSNLSGGVDFSFTGEKLPKLSVGVDFNRFDLRSYQYGLRDRSLSVYAKLDLSKHLPPARGGHKPYLIVKAYGDWSKSGDSFGPDEVKLEPAVMVAFGTRF